MPFDSGKLIYEDYRIYVTETALGLVKVDVAPNGFQT